MALQCIDAALARTGSRTVLLPLAPCMRAQSEEMHDELLSGTVHWFCDWPTGAVPRTGAAVYTVWDRAGRLLYVGFAGREGAGPNGKGPGAG